MIQKMTNRTPGFYELMGPVFGSRDIEKITGDRFFDDDDKIWHIHLSSNGALTACISIKDDIIKNVWGQNEHDLFLLLKGVMEDVMGGIVPNIYEHLYLEAGFTIVDTQDDKRKFVRFMPIQGRMLKEL